MRVLISFVSNIYPKGIQLRNLSSVSNVEPTSGAFCELSLKNKRVTKCTHSVCMFKTKQKLDEKLLDLVDEIDKNDLSRSPNLTPQHFFLLGTGKRQGLQNPKLWTNQNK
jgi:hypothetical protein